MHRFFVYYTDDYAEMGGVGLEYFEKLQDALDWIEARMKGKAEPSLDNYRLIEGEVVEIEPAEVIVKLRTK